MLCFYLNPYNLSEKGIIGLLFLLIMKNELRKVLFNLNEQDLSFGDLGFDDPDNIMEERQGYFHRWGDVIVNDATQERNLQKTVAIIEEMSTGNVYEVAPHCVKYIK